MYLNSDLSFAQSALVLEITHWSPNRHPDALSLAVAQKGGLASSRFSQQTGKLIGVLISMAWSLQLATVQLIPLLPRHQPNVNQIRPCLNRRV